MSQHADHLFYTFKAGPLTIIGFTATEILKPDNIEACRQRLLGLVKEHQCQELVVDLYELPVVSSWILGLLAFIQTQGIKVNLYHPSAAIRDVLQVTRLNQLLKTRGAVAESTDEDV